MKSARYAWSAAGYLIISIPVFFGDSLPTAVVGAGKVEKAVDLKVDPTIEQESSKVATRTESRS
jgi:hypothetical protein